MFQRIINYLHTREGKDVIIGIIAGIILIDGARAICFLVAYLSGYGTNVDWRNIFIFIGNFL